jgi:hypothetical protein
MINIFTDTSGQILDTLTKNASRIALFFFGIEVVPHLK